MNNEFLLGQNSLEVRGESQSDEAKLETEPNYPVRSLFIFFVMRITKDYNFQELML